MLDFTNLIAEKFYKVICVRRKGEKTDVVSDRVPIQVYLDGGKFWSKSLERDKILVLRT